tara:strand:+ start:6412 stop:6693 length:282 start_codon:yes stop_codon:yes gene_type:complete
MDGDKALIIGNLILGFVVLFEQWLGISTCQSNCLVQLLMNNLGMKTGIKKCVHDPDPVIAVSGKDNDSSTKTCGITGDCRCPRCADPKLAKAA